MSKLLLCLLALLPIFVAATPLPPAPDSLRPLLRAARTPAAQQAAWLRVAAAFAAVPDSAGTVAYAQAAGGLAIQRADSVALGRALSLRGFLLLQLAAPAQAAPLLHRAEQLLAPASAPLRWQADAHAYLAWLLGDTNQPTAALRNLRRAYAEYGRLGNAGAQAELSGTATVVYLYQGHADSAAMVLLRAARVQQRLGLAAAEASTLGNLATVLHQLGRLPEAERYARQALATLQRLHDEASQGAIYQVLGNIAWARHRPAEAAAHYRTCVRLLRRQHQEGNLVSCYGSLAGALSDLGQGDSAVYYQTRAVRLCQQLGQTTQAAIEMGALAAIYGHQRRWPAAVQWAQASLAATGPQQLQPERPLLVLEHAAEAQGNYPEALRWARRIRQASEALAARQGQELVQKERARYETDQAEQQVVLLAARSRLQASAQELTRLRTQRVFIGLSALTLLALLLAGGLLWQYRRRQARREAHLRTQIAADLHDDVGTLLSQISLQSSLLQEGLADSIGQRQQLGQISEASRSAVRQLNDVVWSLDAHNDQLPQLFDRLRDYAYEVLAPAGLLVGFDAPAALPALRLPTALRRNLYLIYKEALHNVLKHAPGATRLTVRLALEASPGSLVLEICNDAAPPAPVSAGYQRRSGHGLRNIAERAAALGGTSAVAPLPEGGFRVWVRVPLIG